MASSGDEYLTIRQAAAVFGVRTADVRRVLREHGLGEFVRTSMRKEVLVRRADLEKLLPAAPKPRSRRGAA
jgi:excisionase family DNA binding protein